MHASKLDFLMRMGRGAGTQWAWREVTWSIWKGLAFAASNQHVSAEEAVNPYQGSGELPARCAV
jgi:hypothetical protein